MPAAQMNIRLDSALKASGNAVIAELGYTPSQVVRALWEFATVQGTLPAALTHILQGAKTTAASDIDGESGKAAEGTRIVSSFYERIGIEEPTEGIVDYNELRELAAAEQLEKWGVA